jgi:hypothetical protein
MSPKKICPCLVSKVVYIHGLWELRHGQIFFGDIIQPIMYLSVAGTLCLSAMDTLKALVNELLDLVQTLDTRTKRHIILTPMDHG